MKIKVIRKIVSFKENYFNSTIPADNYEMLLLKQHPSIKYRILDIPDEVLVFLSLIDDSTFFFNEKDFRPCLRNGSIKIIIE